MNFETAACWAVVAWAGAPAVAQVAAPDPVAAPAEVAPATEGVLSYPRDAQRLVARVDGDDIVLQEVLDHLDARHAPGFSRYLATPQGNLYFKEQRFGADWVRQYADIRALQTEAKARGLALEDAEPFLSAALQRAFLEFLQRGRRDGDVAIDADDPTQKLRLARYQQDYGLQAEVQGWLDFLVREATDERVLREYFTGNARVFGGKVTFAHILIRHRDATTLRLLDGDARAAAWERVADIKARLLEDGSNFESVAARHSEDRRTAQRGGQFDYVSRFDRRLPAILCRTAWRLADGAFDGPVESSYGLHFVKRQKYVQNHFMLFTPAKLPEIRATHRQHVQENTLFAVRDKVGVELRY